MERKLNAKASESITTILTGVVFLFFLLRSSECDRIWVEWRTNYWEWNSANIFTMNVYAVIFFISFAINRILVKHWLAIFFTDLVLGVSISDLSDRVNGCYFRTKGDTEMLIYTIVIVVLWLIISHKFIKKIC